MSTTQYWVPPGVIDLGLGHPSLSLLPQELLAQAAQHRFALDDRDALQYGSEQGGPGMRRALAAFLTAEYATRVSADGLMITNGVSQALDMICTVFTHPGDVVLVEEPTYFLALRIFADHGLRVVSAPMDGDGLIPDALEALLAEHRPRLLYTIPTHQNPSGISMSAARRMEVLALCRSHNALLVADEVYHLLTYTGSPPPPFAAHANDPAVLSLGSFSKILGPGLRLGWLHAAPERMAALTAWGVTASGGGLSPFSASIVQSALELDLLGAHVDFLRHTYTVRRDALVAALDAHLSGWLRFAVPDGGYFLWAETTQPVDGLRLATAAAAELVDFRAGPRFSSCGGLGDRLRLCFAYYGEAELEEGVRRLGRALERAATAK